MEPRHLGAARGDERDLGTVAAGKSEFERAGLEMAPSRLVAPPRVAASPCSMECKVVHHLELATWTAETFDQHLVIGQVVGVHLDERAVAGEGVDTAALRPVARCGGPADYTVVERIFRMFRPRVVARDAEAVRLRRPP